MGLQRRDDRGEIVQPAGAPPRLKVRRGPDGKLVVDGEPKGKTVASIEGAERPAQPDDPRSGPLRDVPPYGGF